MQQMRRWLQPHAEGISIACPVIATGAGTLLAIAEEPWAIATLLFVLTVASVLPPWVASANRLHQTQEAATSCLKRVLAACGHAFSAALGHSRVNIMLVTEDGKRRKVDSRTAYNMENDPDRDLDVAVHAGVSGEAYTHGRPAVGDLSFQRTVGAPTWGLLEAEAARVRPTLKSILSVPVFNAADPEGPPMATLQVDSDKEFAETGFADESTRQLAERFADVVAFLLEVRK